MTTTTTSNFFNLQGLNKEAAVALCRHFGLRRDWARVRLAEIRASLAPFGPERLTLAARTLHDYFDDEDIELLTDPTNEFEEDAVRHVLDVTRQSFIKPNPGCSQECQQGRECKCGKKTAGDLKKETS